MHRYPEMSEFDERMQVAELAFLRSNDSRADRDGAELRGPALLTGERMDRYDQGMKTRRAVLGEAHVDRAEAAKSDFDATFQRMITEGAWGTLWSDDTISRCERSMLTLALLAATGNFEEIPMHVRATARTGASPEDIMQAFLHVAVYAGVPKANHAIKLAKQTLTEMEESGDD
jgi:4-carboxymuconolactone decarboxylase